MVTAVMASMRMDRHVACACATGVLVGTAGPSSGSEGNFVYPFAVFLSRELAHLERALLSAWARENGANIHPHIAVAHFETGAPV
jgi:hypothetical protein